MSHKIQTTATTTTTSTAAPASAYGQSNSSSIFEDMLPVMASKLGGEGLIGELCKGFRLLMDEERGAITFESLKRNAGLLGLGDLEDGELRSMMEEGDFDGDGCLSEMEFCVLMFRLSPELMEQSEVLLEEAFRDDDGGEEGDRDCEATMDVDFVDLQRRF